MKVFSQAIIAFRVLVHSTITLGKRIQQSEHCNRQMSISHHKNHKTIAKYYRPYFMIGQQQ